MPSTTTPTLEELLAEIRAAEEIIRQKKTVVERLRKEFRILVQSEEFHAIVLTRREREVLRYKDLQNKEIAQLLGVSVRTVKFHISHLLAKFDVGSRIDLP